MIAIGGAVLFSTKAIVAKLLYRYNIDAITVLTFRMLFSLPLFAALALWQMRIGAPLTAGERWRLVGLELDFRHVVAALVVVLVGRGLTFIVKNIIPLERHPCNNAAQHRLGLRLSSADRPPPV